MLSWLQVSPPTTTVAKLECERASDEARHTMPFTAYQITNEQKRPQEKWAHEHSAGSVFGAIGTPVGVGLERLIHQHKMNH
jgi:hypothetical protein